MTRSGSAAALGPTGSRGCFEAVWFESGGYWLWRLFRTAAEEAKGASALLEAEETSEETLDWRVDVPGCRRMDSVRLGRFAGGCGMLLRLADELDVAGGRSGELLFIVAGWRMLPSPVGDGN